MSNAVKLLPHYTYSDYENWEGRWELIDGIPYAMRPLPVPKHQKIATALSTEFTIMLKECAQCTAYQPIDYRISDDTILQPDMLVVCGEITKNFLDFPPALVVEILSPATALKDRHSKYPIYESQGIPIISLSPRILRKWKSINSIMAPIPWLRKGGISLIPFYWVNALRLLILERYGEPVSLLSTFVGNSQKRFNDFFNLFNGLGAGY